MNIKNIMLWIFICSIVLSGCSQNSWLSQDELFEKKKECLSYMDKILNTSNKHINESSVKETFYSPIKNTCMYVFQNDFEYYIYDILLQKQIFKLTSPYTQCWWIISWFTAEYKLCEQPIDEEFNNKIRELKWE